MTTSDKDQPCPYRKVLSDYRAKSREVARILLSVCERYELDVPEEVLDKARYIRKTVVL